MPEARSYEEIRRRHVEVVEALIPEHVTRISWSRDRIEAEQRRAFRALLEHAVAHSPWHRDRLRGIDLRAITPATIERLPTMTKNDLMESWDAIVTDPRITLDGAENHVAALTTDAYFLDEYHVLVSGGSSGTRGVFLWDWKGYAISFAGMVRGGFRIARELGVDPPSPGVSVSAYSPSHATSALAQTFSNPKLSMTRFPVNLPLAEIVAGLNRVQPVLLQCYASILPILVAEAEEGRLRISPRIVWSGSELLLPEAKAAVERIWKAPVLNGWNTSESMASGFACGFDSGHLCDDLNVVELVDDAGRAVPPGTRSAKVFLTNLHNLAMPLIRYEITDELVAGAKPCRCGSAHTSITDIGGRADETFGYEGGVRVHPLTFRSPLGREAAIVEYQVRQTARGGEIDVVLRSGLDLGRLAAGIETSLRQIGVRDPEVVIRQVETIQRQSSGKLRRFVPRRA